MELDGGPYALEGFLQTTPPEFSERGSRRLPWKSLLLTLGLTAIGVLGGVLVFRLFDTQVAVETLGLRSVGVGAAGTFGLGLSCLLVQYFNVFREDIVIGRKLHPKSPSLLRRS
ncbi:hypothetical protein HY387_00950 [Candidatus Daviesbacteria bacterium]|nr:hypothetical protein [Candidatus Daviesbacteria bacterium]